MPCLLEYSGPWVHRVVEGTGHSGVGLLSLLLCWLGILQGTAFDHQLHRC